METAAFSYAAAVDDVANCSAAVDTTVPQRLSPKMTMAPLQ